MSTEIEAKFRVEDPGTFERIRALSVLGRFSLGEARQGRRLNATVLVSHTHHDHLMGLPFFVPLYLPDASLHFFGPSIYGPVTNGRTDLTYVLEMLMDQTGLTRRRARKPSRVRLFEPGKDAQQG